MAKKPKPPDEVDQLKSLIKQLSQGSTGLSTIGAKRLRERLSEVIGDIADLVTGLDKFREPLSFFDPANPALVGSFVGIGLIAQDRHPLDSVAAFYGSGVYAIYYDGSHPPYKPLVKTEHPIYVGKADPDSPRAKKPREQGTGLFRRLNVDHARAIKKAVGTLDIAHFSCRFLVVQAAGKPQPRITSSIFSSRYGTTRRGSVGGSASTATARRYGATSARRGTRCIRAGCGPDTRSWSTPSRRRGSRQTSPLTTRNIRPSRTSTPS